jgi:hypothetical protein
MLHGTQTFLLFLCAASGVFLLVATFYLIVKRIIYIDAETKQPIQFELPLLGKVRTQSPIVFLLLVSVALILYPLKHAESDTVTLEGDVQTGGKSVTVLVVAVPHYQETLDLGGHFLIKVPLIQSDASYRVKYIIEKQVVYDDVAPTNKGSNKLKPYIYAGSQTTTGTVAPWAQKKKEISDDELRRLNIPH